jgi:hypothetical protein
MRGYKVTEEGDESVAFVVVLVLIDMVVVAMLVIVVAVRSLVQLSHKPKSRSCLFVLHVAKGSQGRSSGTVHLPHPSSISRRKRGNRSRE